jgi:hypothetical protein
VEGKGGIGKSVDKPGQVKQALKLAHCSSLSVPQFWADAKCLKQYCGPKTIAEMQGDERCAFYYCERLTASERQADDFCREMYANYCDDNVLTFNKLTDPKCFERFCEMYTMLDRLNTDTCKNMYIWYCDELAGNGFQWYDDSHCREWKCATDYEPLERLNFHHCVDFGCEWISVNEFNSHNTVCSNLYTPYCNTNYGDIDAGVGAGDPKCLKLFCANLPSIDARVDREECRAMTCAALTPELKAQRDLCNGY